MITLRHPSAPSNRFALKPALATLALIALASAPASAQSFGTVVPAQSIGTTVTIDQLNVHVYATQDGQEYRLWLPYNQQTNDNDLFPVVWQVGSARFRMPGGELYVDPGTGASTFVLYEQNNVFYVQGCSLTRFTQPVGPGQDGPRTPVLPERAEFRTPYNGWGRPTGQNARTYSIQGNIHDGHVEAEAVEAEF